MNARRSLLMLLKAFALICVSIRGLAIDESESAFLRQVESGNAPADSSKPADSRGDLFDVLGTSMTYVSSDGPQVSEPERSLDSSRAETVSTAELLASTLLKPPCA